MSRQAWLDFHMARARALHRQYTQGQVVVRHRAHGYWEEDGNVFSVRCDSCPFLYWRAS